MAPAKVHALRRHQRPMPPTDLLEAEGDRFIPSPDLAHWASTVFIDEDAVLVNEDHAHLRRAEIGFLWTNVANSRRGRSIIGTAERGEPQGAMGKWAKARALAQVRGWFGDVPDFIITVDATYAAECGDAEFCALIEHELAHCGQEHDAFGLPRFTKAGGPVWGLKAHDVETFIGVARRYGAVEAGVRDLVDAVNRGPTIATAQIDGICGSCARKVA